MALPGGPRHLQPVPSTHREPVCPIVGDLQVDVLPDGRLSLRHRADWMQPWGDPFTLEPLPIATLAGGAA